MKRALALLLGIFFIFSNEILASESDGDLVQEGLTSLCINGFEVDSGLGDSVPDSIVNRPSSGEYTKAAILDSFRVVTISLADRSRVELSSGDLGKVIEPGSNLEVMLITTLRGKLAIGSISRSARVLSVDGQTETDSQKTEPPPPSTITLLVTELESQKIQQALTRSTTDRIVLAVKQEKVPASIEGTKCVGREYRADGIEGIIRIDGERFFVVKGKLVPADSN